MTLDGSRILAGAMSGTSADGVDVALVRIDGRGLEMSARLLGHHHEPFDTALREQIFACRSSGEIRLADLAEMGRKISLVYASAVKQSLVAQGLDSQNLSAVAAHGQTLFHGPPNTIQWLDPWLIAAEVGCTVISDFRRADCAAGGQGAPLVPLADHILFSDPLRYRVLLNLGGIANLTYLPAGAGVGSLIAFDAGPGNCVSDFLMRLMHPNGPGVDIDGALASHGKPDDTVVLKMLAAEFFSRRPPRSTDGPEMIDLFHGAIGDLGSRGQLPNNLATACLATATAIVRAMREFLPRFPDEIIVSGGGTNNRMMMSFFGGNSRIFL